MPSPEPTITLICPVVGRKDVMDQTERLPTLVFDLRLERDQALAALFNEYFWLRPNGAAPPRSEVAFIASAMEVWADSPNSTQAIFLADDRQYAERLAQGVLANIRQDRGPAIEQTQFQEATTLPTRTT